MSVRRRTWRDPETGAQKEAWLVDVEFRLPTSRTLRIRRTSPVPTRRGAEEYERRLRGSLLDGSYFKEVDARVAPTMAEFKDDFLIYSTNNNKPSQVYSKTLTLKNHLEPVFGSTRLDQITVPDVEKYKAAKLKDGFCKKTINNHLTVLRKMLNLACEYGRIQHVPRIKQFRVGLDGYDFLSFEEAERVRKACDPAWRAMLTTGLKTGLRLGELLALRWSDVDLVSGRLVVRRSLWKDQEGTPKSGYEREVPLSDAVLEVLKAHRQLRHLKDGYVFCRDDGSRLSHSEVKEVVPRACRAAGLAKRLTWHGLRHTFASHLAMRGVALKAIQELLGHGTIEMTMRYAHLSPDVKRDAVKLLDCAVEETPARHKDGTWNGENEKPQGLPGVS